LLALFEGLTAAGGAAGGGLKAIGGGIAGGLKKMAGGMAKKLAKSLLPEPEAGQQKQEAQPSSKAA
jgi:membrane protease subunit (stomatin/prohibitin family)